MSTKKAGLSVGRPSARSAQEKDRLMASLADDLPVEPKVRVNFELPESKHNKLKIHVVRSEHKSIREFLTAYIDSLPDE